MLTQLTLGMGDQNMTKSKFEFWKEASLSQKLSDKIPILAKLSGTDREISDAIAVLTFLYDPETLTDTPLTWATK